MRQPALQTTAPLDPTPKWPDGYRFRGIPLEPRTDGDDTSLPVQTGNLEDVGTPASSPSPSTTVGYWKPDPCVKCVVAPQILA